MRFMCFWFRVILHLTSRPSHVFDAIERSGPLPLRADGWIFARAGGWQGAVLSVEGLGNYGDYGIIKAASKIRIEVTVQGSSLKGRDAEIHGACAGSKMLPAPIHFRCTFALKLVPSSCRLLAIGPEIFLDIWARSRQG